MFDKGITLLTTSVSNTNSVTLFSLNCSRSLVRFMTSLIRTLLFFLYRPYLIFSDINIHTYIVIKI